MKKRRKWLDGISVMAYQRSKINRKCVCIRRSWDEVNKLLCCRCCKEK